MHSVSVASICSSPKYDTVLCLLIFSMQSCTMLHIGDGINQSMLDSHRHVPSVHLSLITSISGGILARSLIYLPSSKYSDLFGIEHSDVRIR